ncbi:MAG: hypothetical protein LBS75_01910 [Synergistaceae bacterium]|jgi:hypothetical protein|nr:hypothetical protein [Synergistaceae bacterium]
MVPRLKREVREFCGEMPKNKSIVSRIRDNGYYGVLLNKDDFMDAVVWSANLVYEYRDFFLNHKRRIVIPLAELPFWKKDLVNAHFIMLIYYNMKSNFVLVEEFKLSLYTVARFQDVAEEDIRTLEQCDKRSFQSEMDRGSRDIAPEPGELELGESNKTCERYSRLVTQEIERYRSEFLKANV